MDYRDVALFFLLELKSSLTDGFILFSSFFCSCRRFAMSRWTILKSEPLLEGHLGEGIIWLTALLNYHRHPLMSSRRSPIFHRLSL